MMDDQTHFSSDEHVKTLLIVEDDVDIGSFLVQALKDEIPYQPYVNRSTIKRW